MSYFFRALFAFLILFASNALAQDVFFKTNPVAARELSNDDIMNLLQPEILKTPSVRGIVIDPANPQIFTIYASGEMEVSIASFAAKMNAKGVNRKVETANFLNLIKKTIAKSDPFKTNNFKAIIRKKSALDEFEIQTGLKDLPNYIVRRPFIDDLEIAIVTETETSLAFLPKARLSDLGLNEDQVFKDAIAQIEELLPKTKWKVENELLYASIDGAFDASLALVPNLWNTLASQNNAQVALIIPNRGLLVMGRADSESQIAKLKEIAISQTDEKFGLSDKVLLWTGNEWKLSGE